MYTRIIFTIDNQEITFQLHELVKIAIDLMPQLQREKIFIPKEGDFDQFIVKQTTGKDDYAFITGELDPYLIMPMCIKPPSKIGHYLYLAYELAARYQQSKLTAWWLPMGDRLLRIKNTAEYGFYISDHGFHYDIFDRCRKVAILSPWLDGAYVSRLTHVLNQFNALDKPSQANVSNDFRALIAQTPIEKFREEFPSRSSRQLQKLKDELANDASCCQLHFDRFFSEIRYMTEVLRPTLSDLRRKKTDFFSSIVKTYGDEIHLSYAVLQRIVLFEIIKKVNMGSHDPLYRPVFSYGDSEKGDSYPGFEKVIRCYFQRKNALSEFSLARTMRSVLKGQAIEDDSIAFLPNLIAAWFIAESARNPVSLLSGLMLLDMIENQIIYYDANQNNLYSLINTLIHPLKSTEALTANDLYKKSCDLKKIGGSHPMAHTGSKNESLEKLVNEKELNSVRQKEGRIFLHWLIEYFKCHYPKIKVTLGTADKLPVPNYDDLSIENNSRLKKIKTLIKSINKDLKLSNTPNSDKNIQRKQTLEKLNKEQDQIINMSKLKEHVKDEYIVKAFKHRMNNFDSLLENKEAKVNVLDASTSPNKISTTATGNVLTPLMSMMLKSEFPRESLFFTEQKTEELLKLSGKINKESSKNCWSEEPLQSNKLFSIFDKNSNSSHSRQTGSSIKLSDAEIKADQLLFELRGEISRRSLLI